MSKEKKTKQQLNSKQNKIEREKRAKKATYFGVIIGLLAVGIIGIIVWAVNLSPNYITYTVNEHKIDKDFYSCVYYYDTLTSKDWQEYNFDPYKNPYKQQFNYSKADKTFKSWGDYFQSLTDDTLDFLYIMTDTAEKTGYTYSDSVKSNANSEYASVEAEAKEKNTDVEEYLFETYHSEISSKTLKKYLDLYYKANDFYNAITTDKELFIKTFSLEDNFFENYYKKNKAKTDVISYRYYYLENTAENANKIKQFKNVKDEEEFKNLCNLYSASLTYAQNDSSLHENQSIEQIKSLTNSEIAKKITSYSAKENKLYYQNAQIEGKDSIEFVFLIKAAAKDTGAYNKSEVKNWELSVMSLYLEEYKEHFNCAESQKGINQFKKDMGKVFS